MKYPCCDWQTEPFVTNVEDMAMQNPNFRKEIWTGSNVQMTLMSIPVKGEIGKEIHPDTDQIIRIESGMAVAKIGKCKNKFDYCKKICKGDTIFVPAGTWHNVENMGQKPLKISSIYAPPHHPRGTVQRTKEEAEQDY